MFQLKNVVCLQHFTAFVENEVIIMRITNKMRTDSVMNYVNRNNDKMDEINVKLSSGKKIRLPDDDPIGAIKTMHYDSNISEINKYLDNVGNAKSLLEFTDLI